MMTQAFYTGLSGIKSTQTSIDVTSDNIANVNTVGYREYGVEFSSLFETMVTTSNDNSIINSSIGLGSKVQATTMSQANGTLAITQRSSDLAILGDGWFGVSGEEVMFTRAGDFTFDSASNLVTTGGAHVLGTMGNNIVDGVLTETLTEIPLGNVNNQEALNFPTSLVYPVQPTSNVSFYANLGNEGIPTKIGSSAIDAQNNINNLEVAFTKSEVQVTPGSQWNVVATSKTLDGETIYDTQTGVLSFDDSGALISSTLGALNNNGAMVNIDFGEGFTGIMATSAEATSGSSRSDGTAAGDLVGYDVNTFGDVIATFDNGMQSSVGKIAVYHFQNDQGLARIGASSFAQSSDSGDPLFFQDANGNNIIGTEMANYRLENSNVKMEVALTELIIYQRSFDSSSKIISTADEMLKKAIDMGA